MSLSTQRFPSSSNVTMPLETGIVIAFIRDPKKFKLNQYIQYVPTKTELFTWMLLERDRSVRVLNTDEMIWEPGHSRTGMGNNKATRFAMQSGHCIRRNEAATVGWVANEQSHRWDIMATEMKANASVMMTARTKLVWDQLAGGNWQGNTFDANVLNNGRGPWNKGMDDPNSSKYNAISTTILNAARNINLLTNGEVDLEDLVLVLNPDDAIKMSLTAEVRHIVNNTVLAPSRLEGDPKAFQKRWGLPTMIEGIPIVVEDAGIVTGNPLDSGTEATLDVGRNFIAPSGTAYLMARPGSLDGAPGSVSFSTVQVFFFSPGTGSEGGEDGTDFSGLLDAEAFPDPENKLTRCHVSESIDPELAAPLAGMQITNIIG